MALQLKPVKSLHVTMSEAHRLKAANSDSIDPVAEAVPPPADEAKKSRPRPSTSLTSAGTSAAPAEKPKPQVGAKPTAAEVAAESIESVFDARDKFSKLESRVALSAFGFIVFVLSAAWFSWDEQYSIVGDADSAYNYGLVGGLMMLVILIYALRKRARNMRQLGDIRYWYYFHFILGIVGPVLIILHTSFDIRSINGGVALFAMLFVVFSGFIGRYIYTRASYGLRTHEQDMQVVQQHMADGVLHTKVPALKSIETRVKEFTDLALEPPASVDTVVRNIFSMGARARWQYLKINRDLTRIMHNMARSENWTSSSLKAHLTEERRLIRAHMLVAANIGRFQAFEKLAGRWRLLHVPLLYLLVLSGLAHVLAVHMY